ncbi:MAG: 1-acyl-sn-glycerol-3-phosphate acyltransferase [Chloroflexi bacterium]|nr:1-acyl-sn-glycerol-3-phosphate acyltransferase [Chloroflexota bacterium]
MSATEAHYRPAWWNLAARRTLRPVFRGLFRAAYRVRLTGLENIPSRGPYVVVYNHVSIVDPPFILSFWPTHRIETVAAVEVFQRGKGQSLLTWLYGALPIYRGKPDRQQLERLVTVLRSGWPLLLAPEGTRSHTPGMGPGWTGLAYVLDQVGEVPVVPVGVVGSTDAALRAALRGKRPRLEMRVGRPFTLPPLSAWSGPRKRARRLNTDLMMYRLAALLPPEYRGVYAAEPPAELRPYLEEVA